MQRAVKLVSSPRGRGWGNLSPVEKIDTEDQKDVEMEDVQDRSAKMVSSGLTSPPDSPLESPTIVMQLPTTLVLRPKRRTKARARRAEGEGQATLQAILKELNGIWLKKQRFPSSDLDNLLIDDYPKLNKEGKARYMHADTFCGRELVAVAALTKAFFFAIRGDDDVFEALLDNIKLSSNSLVMFAVSRRLPYIELYNHPSAQVTAEVGPLSESAYSIPDA